MGLFVFLTWACKSLETVRKGFIRFPNTPLLEVRPGNLSLRKVVGGVARVSSIGSAACCSVARCPESELGTCSLRGAALPLQRGAAPDQLTQICNRCDYNPSFAQRLRKHMKNEQEEGERG